jgi:hypothetical protein
MEKVGKTFFQSRGAKKSKIADKTCSRIDVFEKGWSKNSLFIKYPLKYDSSN